MRLGGLLKNTALDFPGKFSAAVFTQGCDFTCPYCHNPHLVRPGRASVRQDGGDAHAARPSLSLVSAPPLDEEEVLDFLRRRRPYLDGVVISGGEPALQPDLADFCKKMRGLGYEVKLDTNGSRPEAVADLIKRKLITYAALDLKADPAAYPRELAPSDPGEAIVETIRLLKRSNLPHEFRTTAAAPFVTRESIAAIARAAAGPAPLYIQPYRPGQILNPDFMEAHSQPDRAELEEFRLIASRHLPAYLRR